MNERTALYILMTTILLIALVFAYVSTVSVPSQPPVCTVGSVPVHAGVDGEWVCVVRSSR